MLAFLLQAEGSASDQSDHESAGQSDLLETWMIMEYCEKGSLERGIAGGHFLKADGSPDMVSGWLIDEGCVCICQLQVQP